MVFASKLPKSTTSFGSSEVDKRAAHGKRIARLGHLATKASYEVSLVLDPLP